VTSGLRRGDFVEVRSQAEILSTLDDKGATDALPFMPEMLQYCGQRFYVDARASKVCDTIKKYHSRSIPNAVLLTDQARCEGSAHDGCQAECRIFWKESWLRRIDPDTLASSTRVNQNDNKLLFDLTSRNTKKNFLSDCLPVENYRCQATELNEASTPLSVWDPRPYVREFTSGNVSFERFFRISMRAFIETTLYKLRRIRHRLTVGSSGPSYIWAHLPGTRKGPAPSERLGLKAGDCVQVKTREEIAATLTPDSKDRGMWFDREMLPYCGGTYQIRKRVERIIYDRTSRMIEFKKHDCLILEGVVCSGDLSLHRYLCPRHCYPYWRESWLRRINGEAPSQSSE
jgi:hypothetical protein